MDERGDKHTVEWIDRLATALSTAEAQGYARGFERAKDAALKIAQSWDVGDWDNWSVAEARGGTEAARCIAESIGGEPCRLTPPGDS